MKTLNPLSVLLVEDDEAAREILSSVLAIKFPHIDFCFAENGRAGLACFEQNFPAIVITDINMPEMDGVCMAGKIRELAPDVKLIVLTAFSDKSILESSASAAVTIDHHILKPVDYGKLFTTLGQCLDEIGRDQCLNAAGEVE